MNDLSEAMRRQWLWELVFHIQRMKGTSDGLRSYVKLSR